MTLTEELRRMTGAPTAAYTMNDVDYWTDAQLTDVLAANLHARIVQIPVDLEETVDADGGLVVLQGRVHAPGVIDSADATVIDVDGSAITATVARDGHITFTEDVMSLSPLLTASTYDLNAAAADVLEAWAAAVKLGYDISTDGQSMARSQRHAHLLNQAQLFRARTLPKVVAMVRSDDAYGGQSGRAASALRAFDRIGRRW